jgi:flagellar motor switch protein FliN/FliY
MDKAPEDREPGPKTNPFSAIPIEIIVSVGRARPLIKELVAMSENSVLALDKRIEDPVELYIGDRLIAKGKLEEILDENSKQLAVRLTEISDLKDEL